MQTKNYIETTNKNLMTFKAYFTHFVT